MSARGGTALVIGATSDIGRAAARLDQEVRDIRKATTRYSANRSMEARAMPSWKTAPQLPSRPDAFAPDLPAMAVVTTGLLFMQRNTDRSQGR